MTCTISKVRRGLMVMLTVCGVLFFYILLSVGDGDTANQLQFQSQASTYYRAAHQQHIQQKADYLKVHEISSPPLQSERGLRLSPLSDREIGQRFKHRLELLTAACKRFRGSMLFKPIKVKGKEKKYYYHPMNVTVRYCPIEKASSTTWTVLFRSIDAEMRRRKALTSTFPTERWRRTSERKTAGFRDISFVFVREPYGRLLSAWTDKLLAPNALFWTGVGRYIIHRFRKNPSAKSLRCGHDVTFAEFVEYVIHSQRTGQFRDGHFTPIHDHCDMCGMPYKYVGHLETLNEDLPYLLKLMRSPVNFTKTYDSDTVQGSAMNGLKYMRENVLKCISLDEASRRVWKKLQIRGIISKSESFPLPEEQTTSITAEEFIGVALSALARSGPKSERRRQKKEALREAFAGVPMSTRKMLQRTLFLDFAMFGFDMAPPEVFANEEFENDTGFSYFRLD